MSGPAARHGGPAEPGEARPKVLVVDDDPRILAGLRRQLRRQFDLAIAESGCQGLKILSEDVFAVVVSDMRMPGMDGAAFLARVRVESPQSTRVLLTGQSELSAAIRAVNDGQIFRFLSKPCPPDVLHRCLQEAVGRHLVARNAPLLLSGPMGDRRVLKAPDGGAAAVASGPPVDPAPVIHLRYQPIVELATSRTVAVAAVACGARPAGDGRAGRPPDTLPASAGRGPDMSLSRWVLAAACQEVASWPSLATESMRVHIRLADGQLRDPRFADELARTLILSGVEPRRVTLEIGEAQVIDDHLAVDVLRTITRWGIRLAVVSRHGAAAFSRLTSRLHIDAVKVAVGAPSVDPRAVEAVVDLARSVPVSTIADGVDTGAQQAMVDQCGFELAQGRRYGDPADPGDLLALLADGYHDRMFSVDNWQR